MKYYTHLCCVLAACLLSFSLQAQTADISGQLITDDGKAAEFANVLLLQAADSAVVLLELSDESGNYKFRNVDAGNYLVRVQGIGFEDQFSAPFELAGKDAVFGAQGP